MSLKNSFLAKTPYIIAEIGTSHGGSLEKAKKLILAAKEAGADAAKFQIVYANEIVHPDVGEIPLPSGNINIYEAFKKVEESPEFYKNLKHFCVENKIEFMASAFGSKSLSEYNSLNPNYFKLASPELNDYSFLQEINQTELPVILSTGVSTTSDILNSVAFLKNPVAVLHCITTYPAPEKSCNLAWISNLAKQTRLPVGLSDHTEDPLLAPLVAQYFGATIIEKHIRLDEDKNGLDDSFALSPSQFKEMTTHLKESSLLSHKAQLEKVIQMYDKKRVKKIIGRKKNKLSAHQKKIYKTTNRSWIALTPIKKGEIFSSKNCASLRAERNHKPGWKSTSQNMTPWGKVAKFSIKAGDGVVF